MWDKIVEKLAAILGFFNLFTFVFLLAFPLTPLMKQIVLFFKTGNWFPHSVLKLFSNFSFVSTEWANYPDSWYGFHKFLNYLPSWTFLYLACFISSYFITLPGVILFGGYRDRAYKKLRAGYKDLDEHNLPPNWQTRVDSIFRIEEQLVDGTRGLIMLLFMIVLWHLISI